MVYNGAYISMENVFNLMMGGAYGQVKDLIRCHTSQRWVLACLVGKLVKVNLVVS